MVTLRWPRSSYFTDRARNERYEGPGTFEVPDDAEEQYLSRGWERVNGSSDDTDGEGSTDSQEPARSDLESMSYNQLRTLAADAESEDINGRSARDEIVDALAPDEEPAG